MKFFSDIRSVILILPAALLLAFIDLPVTKTLGFSLLAIFILVGVTHVIRKVLFPYLDMELVFNAAMRDPVPAAVVFASVIGFFCTVLVCSVMWVRG